MAAIAPQIKLTGWRRGLVKRGNAWEIPDDALTVASNVVVRNGRLEPLKGLGSAVHTAGAAPAWMWKLGASWLTHTVARYAVEWESTYLAYVTVGSAPPQWTDGSSTSNLGLSAPTATVTTALGVAGNITGTSLSWVVTFLDSLGQESAPSPAQAAAALLSPVAQKVDLSVIPTSGVLLRKVYRTDASGTYRYVATLNAADTTYTDNTAVSALGDPLLTESAAAAPNLEGLAVKTHRAMVGGWINSTFYRSNVGAPWSWSQGGTDIPEDVVCAAGTGLGFLILTAAKPYLLTGTEFADTTLTPYDNNYGCSASFSLCETDAGWVWWSKRGLILYTRGGQYVPLMEGAFDQDDIDGYSTSGMKAVYASGEVLVFHSGGCLRCDLRSLDSLGPVFTESTLTAGAVWRDNAGTAYVADGTAVKAWAAGSALEMTARCKALKAPNERDRLHVHGAQIDHDGAVTVKWYMDGTQHGSNVSLTSSEDLARIAPGAWNKIALEMISSSDIHGVSINPFSEAA